MRTHLVVLAPELLDQDLRVDSVFQPLHAETLVIATSLTACFLATSATGLLSASRKIFTICSSLNRVFFMGSSLAFEGHLLKNRVVRKLPGRSGIAASQKRPTKK